MPSKNMYSVWKIYANGKHYAKWKKYIRKLKKIYMLIESRFDVSKTTF